MNLIEELKQVIRELVEEGLIEEAFNKQTLNGLVNNFNSIFPNSSYGDLRVTHKKVYGEDTTELKIVTQIKSSSSNGAYSTVIVLRRNDLEEEWNVNMPCEVKCSCPAFKYNVAYGNLKSKNFYGRPDRWARKRPEKKNVKGVPTMCKHLMRAAQEAVQQGIIQQ